MPRNWVRADRAALVSLATRPHDQNAALEDAVILRIALVWYCATRIAMYTVFGRAVPKLWSVLPLWHSDYTPCSNSCVAAMSPWSMLLKFSVARKGLLEMFCYAVSNVLQDRLESIHQY
eukprot:202996-Amphidinium_carterae.1